MRLVIISPHAMDDHKIAYDAMAVARDRYQNTDPLSEAARFGTQAGSTTRESASPAAAAPNSSGQPISFSDAGGITACVA